VNADRRHFTVAGNLGDVLDRRCTAQRLVDVTPEGWGVGAGAIAATSAEALTAIVDSTFLFSTVLVSPSPSGGGTAATSGDLTATGRHHFAPTMTWFGGGAPDLRAGPLPATTQGRLLEETLWPRCGGAAAVGVVALVYVHRTDIAGALIRTSVAAGDEAPPTGGRARFFDLDPLHHRPAFTKGLAWLVAASVRAGAPSGPRADDLRARLAIEPALGRTRAAPPAPEGLTHAHHCHLVLVDDAPACWLNHTTRTPWPALHAAATASVGAQAAGALAIHSDANTTLRPLGLAAWTFGEDEVYTA
jgi:hypothetical protein